MSTIQLSRIPAARTPLDSRVQLQVWLAAKRVDSAGVPWTKLPPDGAPVSGNERWLQYRAVLVGGRGDATPYLEGITIRGFD